jgi:TolB-like protein/Tfp pilus assembly protein PilF
MVQADHFYEFGPFRLIPKSRTLLRENEIVHLTAKAFDLLLTLVENRGVLMKRSVLIDALWPNSFVEDGNLTQNIFILRQTIGDGVKGQRYISTRQGEGYCFVAPIKEYGGRDTLSPPKRPAATSIGVLPLKLLGPNKTLEFLGDGMADAITTALSNSDHIIVRPIATSSSVGQSLIAIGQELKVASVLEGTIQQVEERIRVSVKLIRTEDGAVMWGDRFDHTVTDIFNVQDSIARQVARALHTKLGTDPSKSRSKIHSKSIEAYHLYTKGRYFCDKRMEEPIKKGIECLQQAVTLDPNFAIAHAGIADAYALLGEYLFLDPRIAFPAAKAAALRALEIDANLAEAHSALAEVSLFYDWNLEEAEREIKLALEIDPNYSSAHHCYAWLLMVQKRFDEVSEKVIQAQKKDPMSVQLRTLFGLPFYFNRQYDQAIEHFQQALDMDPNFIPARNYLGHALSGKQLFHEALREFESGLQSRFQQTKTSQGYTHAMLGQRDEALKALDALNELSKQRYASSFCIATVYAGLDDREQVIRYLYKAYEERDSWLVFLSIGPAFDKVRDDARFADLLKRLGLPV